MDGDKLTDDEVIAFLFLMVVAGNETTTKLLGNAWYWGWRNPDQRAKPFADPAAGAGLGRGDPALRHIDADAAPGDPDAARAARQTDPGRARVLLLLGSANRDEDVFAGPRTGTTSTGTPGAGQLRQRPPLLHGRRAGPHGGAHRPTELVERVADLRHRPGRHRAGPLHQRPGPGRAPDDGDPPLMPSASSPIPARRPAVVTGRVVGHRAGHGQGAGRRSATRWCSGRDGWPSARTPPRPSGTTAGRRWPSVSTWPTGPRWSSSPRRPSTSWDRSRSWCRTPPRTSPARRSTPTPRRSTGCSAVNLSGTHRLVRAMVPAMVARRRGDIVFVTSDVVERPRPSHGGLRHLQVGTRGVRPLAADGARGHRRAGHHRAARPHPDRDGDGLGPRRSPARSSSSGRPGASPATPASCARPGWPRPSWPRWACPAAPTPPSSSCSQRRRSPIRGTREHHDHRAGPRDSHHGYPAARRRTVTSTSCGSTRSRLMQPGPLRVRRRRGVPAGPAGRGAADRGRRQRVLLPGPRGGAGPGRGLPVHDAGVRRGRGVRRPARAPSRDAAQPGPAGQVHAGPRRHHRRRGGR